MLQYPALRLSCCKSIACQLFLYASHRDILGGESCQGHQLELHPPKVKCLVCSAIRVLLRQPITSDLTLHPAELLNSLRRLGMITCFFEYLALESEHNNVRNMRICHLLPRA